MYWSNDADMSSLLVREIMLRNYFKKGRAYLHACDNDKFSSDEKCLVVMKKVTFWIHALEVENSIAYK